MLIRRSNVFITLNIIVENFELCPTILMFYVSASKEAPKMSQSHAGIIKIVILRCLLLASK